MVDWSTSMQQTFEYYVVDPATWKDVKPLTSITSSKISWDLDTDTLGSANINATDFISECYVRIYLVTIQNGVKDRRPLGTFLVQTPSSTFDGKMTTVSIDAYTPLMELKENPPPIGYSLLKDDNIMNAAYRIVRENARSPVHMVDSAETLHNDFVSNVSDTWITFVSDLISVAKYNLALDEMGRILFSPKQDTASLQPVWTYTDDNSSILYPDISVKHDMYNVPNVIEVVYSVGEESYHSMVVNDDPNSPISTISRGRIIKRLITNIDLPGEPTQRQVDEYAKQLLRELSTIEYTVTYSHGYCPVRIGDCVRLNYKRAGIVDVKAKVIKQNIDCNVGCKVSETAVFTTKLWG